MIASPNFTQVPNVLFDSIMATLNDSELRVFLTIVRKTFGWSKTRDRISLTQISTMSGLSRTAVINGLYGRKDTATSHPIGGLVQRGLVTVFETDRGNEYLVNVVDYHMSEVVNDVDYSSKHGLPGLVNDVDTQKKSSKETRQNKGEAVASLPRFQKPTLDQVKAYCQERNNSVNPEKWLAHYEANGWRVGKNPMKDWKAAVRTWEHSDFGAAPKPQQTDDSWRFKDPRAERLKGAANAR